MSYLFNNLVTLTNGDAFGRTRISNPFTLADYSHIYGESPELITVTGGNGLATAIPNFACIRLSVGTSSGDYVIHQSRMYHHYLPGKSQNIISSFAFGPTTSNYAAKRIGYYDDRDGIYFQQSGDGCLHWVKRSYVTGTAIDTGITQSDWNLDRCDGTGNSGFNIDTTKTQLIFVDFQWLGVGRLRCGFVHDGEVIYAHEFLHSNILSTVYWSNPSLPIRCEVRNTATASGTASMDQICSTVLSEGGYENSGIDFARFSGQRSITVVNNSLPALSIRLKNSFNGFPNRSTVRINSIDALAENATIRYELWRLPGGTVSGTQSIQGGTWTSHSDDSVVEYNNTATGWTASGGFLMEIGYLAANATGGQGQTRVPSSPQIQNPTNSKRSFISQNYDSTNSNIFVVVVTALAVNGGTNDFRIGLQWRETK